MSYQKHYFIKDIVFSRKTFSILTRDIETKYSKFSAKSMPSEMFFRWSLVARILGIFKSFGDKQASELFFDCVMQDYLPKILISENKKDDSVKICICIVQNKKNGQCTRIFNTKKQS